MKNRHRNVQQHFVTAAYLAGFTPQSSRDSQLWVYERNSEKVFRLIPDKAAKRRDYYSIPQQSGGFSDIVDAMLTSIEGQAIPVLQKLLDRDGVLTVDERMYFAFLIAFQEYRTPWARSWFQKMEVHLQTQLMHTAAQAPGYLESTLDELKATDTLLNYWLQLKTELGIMPDSPLIDQIQNFVREFDSSTDARASDRFAEALYSLTRSVGQRAQRSA